MTSFYRNYTVIDLCLSAFATVLLALASFRQGVRATICEELALQPDLLRELDLGEIGLSPENCEQWFEHAVVAFVGVVAIILVVRVSLFSLVIIPFTLDNCANVIYFRPPLISDHLEIYNSCNSFSL